MTIIWLIAKTHTHRHCSFFPPEEDSLVRTTNATHSSQTSEHFFLCCRGSSADDASIPAHPYGLALWSAMMIHQIICNQSSTQERERANAGSFESIEWLFFRIGWNYEQNNPLINYQNDQINENINENFKTFTEI